MLDQLQGLHIETTNMCTLKCPRCSRTTFIETFKPKNWDNTNLDLNQLKKFLDIDLSNLNISLNGNNGDPIYYPELLDLIEFLKSKGSNIIIQTNGSYKTSDWWHQLGNLLDSNDIVNFSIDGTPDNFTNYRINADWASIKNGIDILVKTPCKVVWKYIVFRYNESSIDQAKEISIQLEMDDFVAVNSDRWVDNDNLKPLKYIKIDNAPQSGILSSGAHIGGRDNSIQRWKNNFNDIKVNPVCKMNNNMHFISAEGFYSPCCWAADYRFYYQSEFYKNKDLYDISKTTLSKILLEPKTINFYDNIEELKPKYCTYNCGTI